VRLPDCGTGQECVRQLLVTVWWPQRRMTCCTLLIFLNFYAAILSV
jgi:hypothetical protein